MTRAEMRQRIAQMERGIMDAYATELLEGSQWSQRAILLEADHKLLKRLANRLIKRGLA